MGRVALVTGGSRGIGEAISKALKADGNEVAVETIEIAHEGLSIENS